MREYAIEVEISLEAYKPGTENLLQYSSEKIHYREARVIKLRAVNEKQAIEIAGEIFAWIGPVKTKTLEVVSDW